MFWKVGKILIKDIEKEYAGHFKSIKHTADLSALRGESEATI